jgi:acyl-ACP thioesterase
MGFFSWRPRYEIDIGTFASYILPAMEPNVWRQNFTIRSYEVDCHSRLSIVSIFNFMQEAASQHADALGVSIQQLLSENYTWLLSRLKIKMNMYPVWNDQLTVNTWPSGIQRLFALRDFELKDRANRTVGAALSAWLVVDTVKKRPVRVSSFVDRLKPVEGDHILPDQLGKLPVIEAHTHERYLRVRYGDLDINQHVNNACYVEWMLEGMPVDVLNGRALAELEINFLAESFLQDRVVARCQPLDSGNREFLHSLIRQADGQELVRARTGWRSLEGA